MQAKSVFFSLLIIAGIALLANSWVVNGPAGEEKGEPEKNRMAVNAHALPQNKRTPMHGEHIQRRSDTLPPTRADTLTVDTRIRDLILSTRIQKALFRNKRTRHLSVALSVTDGRVSVQGGQLSEEDRSALESTIRRVRNINSVEFTERM